ncbi:hypothetical protein BDZ85DRAFT_282766 [Elsinoe ampelina]|uniref:Uncharacterized protein n=1 Tax=Elsinoe ampelina TaxID=302913 RepID=A0A6A6GAY5_9PEZI|nr:hypothetical protein BDZ85DRAFT_282766 [Elsinoe ampelina]
MPQSGEQDIPWTASRCLRLLRPITSRIEPLQRLVVSRKTNQGDSWKFDRESSSSPEVQDALMSSPLQREDPTWVPKGPADLTRTYSARHRRQYVQVPAAPKLNAPVATPAAGPTLPTPYRQPAMPDLDVSSGESAGTDMDESNRNQGASRKRSKLSQSQSGDPELVSTPKSRQRANLRAGILDALKTVLERTRDMETSTAELYSEMRHRVGYTHDTTKAIQDADHPASAAPQLQGFGIHESRHPLRQTKQSLPEEHQSRKQHPAIHGAASLFDICLRKVPVLIEQEQHQRQIDKEDNSESNVASEIYDDLECLGSAVASYPPLRKVVRAHALHLVIGLFRQGTLTKLTLHDVVTSLVDKATRSELHRFLDAVSHLLEINDAMDLNDAVSVWPPEGPIMMLPGWLIGRYFSTWHLGSQDQSLHGFGRPDWSTWLMYICGKFARETQGESLVGLEEILAACGVPEVREDGSTSWDKRSGVSFGGPNIRLVAGNLEQPLVVLASMALLGLKAPFDDLKYATALSITTAFRVATIRVFRDLDTIAHASGGAGSDVGWKPLTTKLLTLTMVLQSTAQERTNAHTSLDPNCIITAMRRVWFPKQDWRADKSRLQYSLDALHSVAVCVGSENRDRAADALYDCVRPLMDIAYDCDEVSASFLRELCVESTRRMAKLYNLPKARRIARDIDEECEALGEKIAKSKWEEADLHDPLRKQRHYMYDDGLREWIAYSPPRSKAVVVSHKRPSSTTDDGRPSKIRKAVPDIDDSGYASGSLSPETPARGHRKALVPGSPDELGPNWTPSRLNLSSRSPIQDTEETNHHVHSSPTQAAPPLVDDSNSNDVGSANDGPDELALDVRQPRPRSSARVVSTGSPRDPIVIDAAEEVNTRSRVRPRAPNTALPVGRSGNPIIMHDEDDDFDELG